MSLRNEAAFWRKVYAAFKARPSAVIKKLPADAGYAGKGVPDGSYAVDGVAGKLELKYVREWPARESTTVPVELTEEQRNWMEEWSAGSGRAHVLLGVADEWFVLELHEVPTDNRMTRRALDAIRKQGRAGAMREIARLPDVMARIHGPVVD